MSGVDDGVSDREQPVDEQDQRVVVSTDYRYIVSKKVLRTESTEDVVDIKKIDGPVARIRRSLGLTLNLGNYESAKIEVSIELPCHIMDIELADRFAREFAEERISQEVMKTRKPKGNGGTF